MTAEWGDSVTQDGAPRHCRRAVLAGMLLALIPDAAALNPALDVSQYAQRRWRIRDGFSKGAVSSIVQTSDGYLWLGTEFGLLRFDGVRPLPGSRHRVSSFLPAGFSACSPPPMGLFGLALRKDFPVGRTAS